MIVEGCEILLDVNQMFVRQGTLVQIIQRESSSSGARVVRLAAMGNKDKDREAVRQCFLFSNHLIVTTRTQAGRLHLVDNIGRIALADVTLIEDPSEEDRMEEPGSPCSSTGSVSGESNVSNCSKSDQKCLDFKLIVDDVKTGRQITVHLAAPTKQEKAAWITDITQVTSSHCLSVG